MGIATMPPDFAVLTSKRNRRNGNGNGNGNNRNNNNNNNNNDTDLLESFFLGWEAAFCGGPRSAEALSNDVVEEPDVLDYVFEKVESFTCIDDDNNENDNMNEDAANSPFRSFHHKKDPYGPYGHKGSHDPFRGMERERTPPTTGRNYYCGSGGGGGSFDDSLQLRRENSLVEKGPDGAPVTLVKQQQYHPISPNSNRSPSLLSRLQHGREGDLLDYCFEHVESYTCNNNHHNNTNHNTREGGYGKNGNGNGNPKSHPHGKTPRTPRRNTTRPHHFATTAAVTPESHNHHHHHPIPTEIVTPSSSTTRRSKKLRRDKALLRHQRPKPNYYPDCDEEDNILLYYRPTTTK